MCCFLFFFLEEEEDAEDDDAHHYYKLVVLDILESERNFVQDLRVSGSGLNDTKRGRRS